MAWWTTASEHMNLIDKPHIAAVICYKNWQPRLLAFIASAMAVRGNRGNETLLKFGLSRKSGETLQRNNMAAKP